MALTAAQQTDAYRFFSIAFNAAPGVEYMNQIADAYASGMTTQQVVNAFVSKTQFTNVYPTFLTNETFANNLVENIVGSAAAAAAKTQAKADIVAALNSGMSRGDVVYTIFNNLANKPATDADWGATATLMANKVAVAQYYTEVLLGNTTNLATLQSVLAGVTPTTNVSTPAAIQALLGDVFNAQGQTFTLTTSADQVPGMNGSAGTISTTGNDVYVANNSTLSSADRIVDAAGNADKLKYSSQVSVGHSAFEMKGVETLEVTADGGTTESGFDLSGAQGLTLLKSLNSTGRTAFGQVTSLANIEVNNVTSSSSAPVNHQVAVQYQDSVVSGAANEVTLTLANNSNVNPVGGVWIGRVADGNMNPGTGIETLNVVTSGSAATLTRLTSQISTMNVSGDQNLTIQDALQPTVDTIAAGGFTGALNVNLTGNVLGRGALPAAPGVANTDGVLSITTGSGNDVIDLLVGSAGTATRAPTAAEPDNALGFGEDRSTGVGNGQVTRNATISTGAGNDYVEAGLGDDNINLGEGNDSLVLTVGGLTVADLVTGGAGADQLTLNTTDSISKSEAERVTQIETVNLLAAGSTFVVTDNLLTTADGGMFTINTNNGTTDPVSGLQNGQLTTGGHTIDLTNVSFNNTGNFTLNGNGFVAANAVWGGQAGTGDTVIANDATVNAKATLTFGQDAAFNGTPANTYTGDTLRIVDGGDYRFDDFANVTGLDVIELMANTNIAQTYNLELLSSMIDNRDSGNNAVGDANDDLVIKISRNVPQGSVVNIDAAQISATQRVTVYNNSNVTVNVTNNGAGRVTVLSSLEFTENADNLVGTAADDFFSADSLDQLDTADNAAGNAGTDTLQLNFGVFNANPGVGLFANLFNAANISSMENVVFAVDTDVSFRDDSTGGIGGHGVVSYTTGAGNDVVTHNLNGRTVTYNLGAGTNTFRDDILTDGTGAVATVNTGAGADQVFTDNDTNVGGAVDNVGDTFNLGAGTDTLHINGALASVIGATVVGGSHYNLSGVDVVNFTATAASFAPTATGLTIQNTAVSQTDSGLVLTVNVNDANGVANLVAIADASAVIGPRSVNITMVTTAGAGQGTDAADILGGSGNDVLSLGTSGVTGYAIQGNAGADTIDISGAGVGGAMVRYASSNDGGAQGAQGANAGYDTITGFVSGTDEVGFTAAGISTVFFNQVVGNMVRVQDAAVNFNATHHAMVLTQVGNGVTNAELLDLAVIASKANVHGVTAAATDGGLIVVNGQSQAAVYLYVEQDGTANNVATSELKILGIFDTNALGLAATDLQIV